MADADVFCEMYAALRAAMTELVRLKAEPVIVAKVASAVIRAHESGCVQK